MRTLLSLEYRTGSTTVQDMHGIDLKDLLKKHDLCQRMLKKFNCDWTSHTVAHVCPGSHCCHGGEASCRDEMFTLCLECDVTLSSDTTKPSLDDWGSALHCGVKVALGILLHELLPQCVDRALPTWASMAAGNDTLLSSPEDIEAASIERLKIQKKAWRSRSVLHCPWKK